MEQKRIDPKIISLIVIVLIAAAAGTVYLTGKDHNNNATSAQSRMPGTSEMGMKDGSNSANNDSNVATGRYRDGQYTETGNYATPGGSESVTVTVTLANGTVTAVDATGSASGGEAAQYQSAFLSGYKSSVVGKSIDDVSLSRVAGSSLTSGGFNRAITTIKNDAAS